MRSFRQFYTEEIELWEDVCYNFGTEFDKEPFIDNILLKKITSHIHGKDNKGYKETEINSYARMVIEYNDEFIYQKEIKLLFNKILYMMKNLIEK